ncbi:10875_t:CDS:2 [Dentiscutata heterogama]|uniref:10875_t:CDS:1 n=1 Tax=Dentiscutata heterogama TaxID=1316150 RepID=A0ACA9KMB0_9GLOM|nr:10875_t:CDS:2 [Dentiscutata heterogama]
MNGPPKISYIKYDKHAFFTYSSKDIKTFQHGYLGIGPSFIAGNFHLHYPINKPLYLKKVEISLIGQESTLCESIFKRFHEKFSRVFCHYTYNAWENLDYQPVTNLNLRFNIKLEDDLPSSFNIDYNIYASINYILEARIITNKNVEKIISVKCQVNRWCLPAETLERPIIMKCPDYDKAFKEYKVGDTMVKCELKKFLWSMGDDISMCVNLTSLKSTMTDLNIIKIKLQLIELQCIVKNNTIIAANKIESTKVIIDKKKLSTLSQPSGSKYSFEVGMKIPSKNNTKFTPLNIYTKAFQRILIAHSLKAKIEFKNGDHFVFQGDIGIINSLTPKEIKEGKEIGLIYSEKS